MLNLALSPMLILEIVIVASFIITSIFMFKPKDNDGVHKIFFWLGVLLNVLVTFINATSYPEGMFTQVIVAWAGLVFTGIGIVIHIWVGKKNTVANVLVMMATIYGCASYFIMG